MSFLKRFAGKARKLFAKGSTTRGKEKDHVEAIIQPRQPTKIISAGPVGNPYFGSKFDSRMWERGSNPGGHSPIPRSSDESRVANDDTSTDIVIGAAIFAATSDNSGTANSGHHIDTGHCGTSDSGGSGGDSGSSCSDSGSGSSGDW